MLRFVDKPHTIRIFLDKHKGRVKRKVVYLHGKDDSIDEVIKKRCKDTSSCQLPRAKIYHQISYYHVRIFYDVCSEGVFIRRIDVQLEGKWSLFYNIDSVGDMTCNDGRRKRYFLRENDCLEQISKYEEAREILRLASLGPDVFPRKKCEQ